MPSVTKFSLTLLSIIFIFSLASEAESAQVFRCFGKKVNKGDTTYSVLKKCGDPSYKETLSCEDCVKREKWHYDCIGRGYVVELLFKNGILIKRNRGGKSSGQQTCK